MTADQIFDLVLTLLFAPASEKAARTPDFLNALNIALAECFDAENGLRAPEEQLARPPLLTALGERPGYNWRLEPILAYGTAAALFADEEAGTAALYRNKYEAERALLVRARFAEMEDCYA